MRSHVLLFLVVMIKKSSVSKSKSKSDYCVAKAISDTECSDSEDSAKRADRRCVARNEKLKPSKRAVDSVRDCSEAQSSKSVCSKRCVSDRKRSVCSKGSAEKSGDQRPHRRESSVHVDSETESDDKSCAVDKRRAYIKPDKFNENTPTFATFKAQFMNAAKFNKWNDDEQLAFMKSSLTGSAAQCVWDQDESCTDTLNKLWKLL